MLHRMDVETLLRNLNRVLPVRHRNLLTRRNTVRLRYMALPGFGVSGLALITTAMLSPVLSPVLSGASLPGLSGQAQIAAVAADLPGTGNEDSLRERFALSQKRLKRSMDDVATTQGPDQNDDRQATQLAAVAPAAAPAESPAADIRPEQNSSQPSAPQERTVKIGSGDTLTGVLSRAGLSNDEAYQVVEALHKHVDPRALKPGQTLNIRFDPANGPARNSAFQFASLNMAVDPLRTVSVAKGGDDDGYRVDMHEKSLQKHVYAQEAVVENSLFGAAAKAGIPPAVLADAIRVYSYDVDFQRDLREGDKIRVMYEQYETADGTKIKTGNLIYAQLTLSDIDIPIYRYQRPDGSADYYQNNGRSLKKTLMKTPIDGARVSSGFGLRLHPILGYTKMHKGIDFAAPTGTPIFAAGEGTVVKAGRASGYGNYVQLRHTNQMATAYGHMSRIAVSPGAHVRQGQVIGYVGMTGSATGPHLHYEILVNNVQVNPRSVTLPIGQNLEGQQLKLFQANARAVDRNFAVLHGTKVAQNRGDDAVQTAAVR